MLVGRVAAHAVLGADVAITKEYGRLAESGGGTYFLTFHPATVLHNLSPSDSVEEDTKKLYGLSSDMRQ